MGTPTTLIALPLEIRLQIYSYMLVNDYIIDMIAANVTRPQDHGLFLACRQLHFEAFDYYYNANTFQLSLSDPTYSPDEYLHGNAILMNRLSKMRNLHVEIAPMVKHRLVDGTVENADSLRHENGFRWRRFTKRLADVHEGQTGWLLRSLVIVDRYAPIPLVFDHLNQKLIGPPITPSVLERKTMALMRLVKPLEDRIGAITFEIRSGYVWTPLVPIGDYPYEVRASSAVPPR